MLWTSSNRKYINTKQFATEERRYKNGFPLSSLHHCSFASRPRRSPVDLNLPAGSRHSRGHSCPHGCICEYLIVGDCYCLISYASTGHVMHSSIYASKMLFVIGVSLRSYLFVPLLLIFWKSWLITNWIVDCLILGVEFYNIYLVFLHIKSLKSSSRWAFQLLFISLKACFSVF
jgi:hypothetical protein